MNSLMNDQPDREAALFNTARRLPADQRAAYLEEACAGDVVLRQRVQELLESSDEAGDFLEASPAGPHTIRVDVPLEEKPGDKIGHYKLLQQIGEGGCGVVYMAEQEEPVRRRVALKVIKLGMDTRSVIARFEAERQALALMDHPNIAKVFDAGATETGRPYFVMELVRGIKITEFCDENNLPTEERLKLFVQVCQAIQHAHQKGVIHRDLKPSNVLVTINDSVPVPKVIDFGIAKSTQGRLTDQTLFTAFQQFIGTPAYMSPEQAVMTSLDIDTRSDIYSLGVLLYELLTGGTPFDQKELLAAGLDEMRRTILEKEPPRPSTRLSTMAADAIATTARQRHTDVPKLIHLLRGDLDWIVMKALDKDRTRRYETANGLAVDIRRHLNNEPVIARPPSAAYRFQKAFRRNKLAFTATAAVTAALVAGIAISTRQTFVAREAQRQTEAARLNERQQRLEAQTAQKLAESERERAERSELAVRQNSYVSDMLSVQQALAQFNLGRARELLRAQEPRNARPDLRGWEWWYYAGQCQNSDAFTVERGLNSVTALASAPLHGGVIAGTAYGSIELWDLANQKLVAQLAKEEEEIVALASDSEGRFLASRTRSGPVKIWDIANANNVRLVRTLSTNFLYEGRAFSSRNHLIALVVTNAAPLPLVAGKADGDNGVTGVWNWETGELLKVLPESGADAVFSDDGRFLVTGSWNELVTIWNIENWEPVQKLKPTGHVLCMDFSPDGNRLVTGNREGEVMLWDANQGRLIGLFRGHSSRVAGVAFSPDGHRLATASDDQTVGLWEVATQRGLARFKGHEGPVQRVAFSPDGKWLAGALSRDGAMRFWNAKPSTETAPAARPASLPVFSPDNRTLAYGNDSGQVDLWDIETKTLKETLPCEPNPVGFTSDGSNLITATVATPLPLYPNRIAGLKFWKRGWQTPANVVEFSSSNLVASAVSLSPDGALLATGDLQGNVRLWDTTTGKLRKEWSPGPQRVWTLVFAPDGKVLAVGFRDAMILWNFETGRTVSVAGAGTAVAFSPDGATLATGYFNKVRLWEAATGEELVSIDGHRDMVIWLAFSKDGRTLASAGEDLKLWNTVTRREVGRFLPQSAPLFVQFSPDGRTLVAGKIGELHLWTAASEEELFQRFDRIAELVRAKIPHRASGTPPNLLDLSRYYNATLTEDWHPGAEQNNLAQLPRGIQEFAGVRFDVRGLIQVGSGDRNGQHYPDRVPKIVVQRPCRRLHFLHAAISAFGKTGTQVGSYVIHFANGQTREIPILLGRDVADWWKQDEQPGSQLTVAWTGDNAASRRDARTIRLFKTTWENPLPSVAIESFDFNWAGTEAAPFLVGVTTQ